MQQPTSIARNQIQIPNSQPTSPGRSLGAERSLAVEDLGAAHAVADVDLVEEAVLAALLLVEHELLPEQPRGRGRQRLGKCERRWEVSES